MRELLAPLDLEPHVLPGNHDLRGPLREAFGLPGEGDEPASHVVDLGPLRLVCLDSTIPGAEGGALDEGRIEWLDAALGEEREKPTVLAMHHPPLRTEIPTFERIGLAPEARAALAEVLVRHRQVVRVSPGTCTGRSSPSWPGAPSSPSPAPTCRRRSSFTAPNRDAPRPARLRDPRAARRGAGLAPADVRAS